MTASGQQKYPGDLGWLAGDAEHLVLGLELRVEADRDWTRQPATTAVRATCSRKHPLLRERSCRDARTGEAAAGHGSTPVLQIGSPLRSDGDHVAGTGRPRTEACNRQGVRTRRSTLSVHDATALPKRLAASRIEQPPGRAGQVGIPPVHAPARRTRRACRIGPAADREGGDQLSSAFPASARSTISPMPTIRLSSRRTPSSCLRSSASWSSPQSCSMASPRPLVRCHLKRRA